MASWGSTTVYVRRGTYQSAPAATINEIKILPAAGSTAAASVIQSGGRARRRIMFEAYVPTVAEYEDLADDYHAHTSRTWTDPDGDTLTSIIAELGPLQRQSKGFYTFTIILLEA